MDLDTKIKLCKGIFIEIWSALHPGLVRPITVTLNKKLITNFYPGPLRHIRCVTGKIEGKTITIAEPSTIAKDIPAHWSLLGFRCAWVTTDRTNTAFMIQDPQSKEVLLFTGRNCVKQAGDALRKQINEKWSQRLNEI